MAKTGSAAGLTQGEVTAALVSLIIVQPQGLDVEPAALHVHHGGIPDASPSDILVSGPIVAVRPIVNEPQRPPRRSR
jgi:hypothetical protein